MIDISGKNLIFLISQPRAGSTLLQLMLAGHPDIATTSEPWIALHPFFALRARGLEAAYDSLSAHEALVEFLGQSGVTEEFYKKQAASFIISLYNQAIKHQNRKIFLDKTPRYYHILDELINVFPEAKFIILFRNPLAVLSSMIKTLVKDGDLSLLGDYRDDLIKAPQIMVDIIRKYPGRSMCVKYEDLIMKSEIKVRDICEYLGLKYHTNMLEYSKRVRQDWKYEEAGSLDKWKQGFKSTQHVIFARSYLETLGPELITMMGYDYQELKAVVDISIENTEGNLISWTTVMHETEGFPTSRLVRDMLYRILADNTVWSGNIKDGDLRNSDLEWLELMQLTARRFVDPVTKPLIEERDRLLNSFSWRLTSPLRNIIRPFRIGGRFVGPGIARLGGRKKAKRMKLNLTPATIINKLPHYPVISIVTPSYNQAIFLEETIKSIVNQNYPSMEYIIMDGGSTDGSREIIERYKNKLAFWASQKDKGQTNALNIGFSRSTGEIMAYLNSDDLLLPGVLHYVAKYFSDHPDVDAVYGHRIVINKDGYEIGRWILPEHDDDVIRIMDFVPQETLFWRRRIWKKAGSGFDESFHYAMDWDLILKFIKNKAKIRRIPVFIGAFRVHDSQKTTASLDVGNKEVERLRMKYFGYIPSPGEIDKTIRHYLLKAKLLEIKWKLKLVHYDI